MRILYLLSILAIGWLAVAAPCFTVTVNAVGAVEAGRNDAPPATITVTGNADWRGTVTIRNAVGQLARILYLDVKKVIPADQTLELRWDGTDDDGLLPVPVGRYTVRVEAIKRNPDHTLGGRTLPAGSYTDTKVILDPRLDCWYLANGYTNGEEPFSYDDNPEAVLRRFSFDGEPLGPEIGLNTEFLGEGNLIAMDIHGDFYIGPLTPPFWAFPQVYKLDGRTGKILWTGWMVFDKTTGKPRVIDGTHFDGESIHPVTNQATCRSTEMWDTDSVVTWGGVNVRFNAHTGEVLERPTGVEYGLMRKAPDGSMYLTPGYSVGRMAHYDATGKRLWRLEWTDYNKDSDLLDPPDPVTGIGESRIIWGSDHNAFAVDVEGNVYGRSAYDVDGRTLEAAGIVHKLYDGNPKYLGALLKYDQNGQLLLYAAYNDLAAAGQYPYYAMTKLDVSEDGKLAAWSVFSGAGQGLSQMDYATATVEVTASPAKALRRALPAVWQADMLTRLPDNTQADALNRGRLFLARKQFHEAIVALKNATGGVDADIAATAYHLWALALWRQGQPAQAADIYRQCAQKLPVEKPRALLQAARCLDEVGQQDAALAALAEAALADTDGYWAGLATLRRVNLLLKTGKPQDAATLTTNALPRYPLLAPQLLSAQATALLDAGKPKDAALALESARKTYPIFASAITALYRTALQQSGTSAPPVATPTKPVLGTAGDLWPDAILVNKNGTEPYIIALNGSSVDAARRTMQSRSRCTLGVYSDGKRLYTAENWYCRVIGVTVADLQPPGEIEDEDAPEPAGHVGGMPRKLQGVTFGQTQGDYMTGVRGDAAMRVYRADIRAEQEKQGMKAVTSFTPAGITGNGETLFVTDSQFHRLLVYNKVPATPNTAADVALGQPNLLDGVPNFGGVSASSLHTPQGVWCDGKYLWVCDRGNHRVLRWTLPITKHAQPADLVLGQPDCTTNARNAGGLSASSLNRPSWVCSDGTRLVVSDSMNQRVLVWNTLPTRNGQPADVVLGQKDFATCLGWSRMGNGYVGMDSFAKPLGVLLDAGKLYVCDADNRRVLVWNALPTRNGQPADAALLPPINGDFGWPAAIAADDVSVYVTDYTADLVSKVFIYWK